MLGFLLYEQLSRRKRRLIDKRNFAGCVGLFRSVRVAFALAKRLRQHSSTQPTDPLQRQIQACSLPPQPFDRILSPIPY
jgi:hypothetical protein